ncbi:MAG: hypothetical protein ABJN95_18315 [Maribacter sp.]|uniref:hypothetical protein n=1 Tax=Maribacter sp. TaxID=1897614 RepID=UPI003297C536
MKTSLSLVLFTILISLTSSKCERLPSGRDLDANSFEIYYKINDTTNYQTLQFQACNKIFYTVVGKFKGQKINDSIYEIQNLDMRAHLLRGYPPFKNKELQLNDILITHSESTNSLLFYYRLTPVDSTKLFQSKYVKPSTFPIRVKNNVSISFVAASKNIHLLKTCAMGEYDENSNTERIVTGGGYECNGKGIISGNQ